MIKAITGNKFVKNIAVATMLTAGVLTGNALNGKSKTNVTNPNQTEIVSKTAAQALQAYNQQSIPTTSNSQQLNYVLSLAKKLPLSADESAKLAGSLAADIRNYAIEYGSYEGTVQSQEILYEKTLVSIGKEGIIQLKSKKDLIDSDVIDYIFNQTNKYLAEVSEYIAKFDNAQIEAFNLPNRKPTSQEVNNFLDKYVQELDIISAEQKAEYKRNVNSFKTKQNNQTSLQNVTNLIAYKTLLIQHLTNKALIKNYNLTTVYDYQNNSQNEPNVLDKIFDFIEIQPQ